MDYLEYDFHLQAPEQSHLLLAYLNQLPFEAFVEHEKGLRAYLPENEQKKEIERQVDDLRKRFPFTLEVGSIPAKNWNTAWEANFQPVTVGRFCHIRAPFHDPVEDGVMEVIIHPKMAFGTGHHATTYLMIKLLEELDFHGKDILDFGCGTGILAIVAAKMGAESVDAVDIDHWSIENTLENAALNQVTTIHTYLGNAAVIPDQTYQIVLANINLNVILTCLSTLYARLKRAGKILFSGVLVSDLPKLTTALERAGFVVEKHLERGGWLALQCTRL